MKRWKLYSLRHQDVPEVKYEVAVWGQPALHSFQDLLFNKWVYYYGLLVHGVKPRRNAFLVGRLGDHWVTDNQFRPALLAGKYSAPLVSTKRKQADKLEQLAQREPVARFRVGSWSRGFDVEGSDTDLMTLYWPTQHELANLSGFPRVMGGDDLHMSTYDLNTIATASWKQWCDGWVKPLEVVDERGYQNMLDNRPPFTKMLVHKALGLLTSYTARHTAKGLGHAVNIVHELEYALEHGRLDYPMVCADYVRQLRNGEASLTEAAEYVDAKLHSMAGNFSELPEA